MKLRQKLAMVLAASMIVTAVPVTTMAYSNNQITNIMSAIQGQVVSYDDGLKLVMDFEDSIQAPFDTKEEAAVKTMRYLGEKLVTAANQEGADQISIADLYTHIAGVNGNGRYQRDVNGNLVVNYSEASNATMFYVDATDFEFSKTDYMDVAGVDKAAIEAARTTLAAEIQNVIKADKTAASRKITTAAGTINPDSVKVESDDITIAGTVKAGDVVAKVEVTVFVDEKGTTEKREIEYTRADLEAIAKEMGTTQVKALQDAFKAVEDLYNQENPLFVFEGNAQTKMATKFNGTVLVEYLSANRLRVFVIDTDTAEAGAKVAVPMMGKMTGKSPVVKVDPYDSSSSASASTHYLTKDAIGSKALDFKAADATKITVNGGKLAGFTIAENKEDALQNGAVVKLDLGKYSDLEFSKDQEIKLVGKNAFAPGEVTLTVDKKDITVANNGQELLINIPDGRAVGSTTGSWVVSGAKVEAKSLKYGAEVGDVNVTVSEANNAFEKTTVKLGEVVEFGVTVDVKPAQLIAGRVNDTEDKEKKAKLEEAVITLTEGVNESFDDKRWAYFEMPEGIQVKVADFNAVEKSVKINGDAADPGAAKFKLDKDKEGVYVKGFSIEFEYTNNDEDEGKMVVDKANKVEFTIPFCAPLGTEPGDYNLEIISQYMPELEGEIKVAEVVAPVEVTFEQKDVKVGLEKQEMGNITITETANKMIREGELEIYLDDIKLETAKKDIVLETTEGSKMDVRVKSVTSDKEGSTIVLAVDREAKEKAAITIKGLVGTVYRTVPEGGTDILVSGTSILDAHCKLSTDKVKDNLDYITVEDYNAVPTKNTEDINSASKLNTVKITADATSYEVNGEVKEITSDLVAFNNANGNMMAPVRLVGTAFGAEFSYGTINGATVVTFFKDGKAVAFTNGSNVMNVNGVQSVMAAPATIKEGRLFVPLRDLANALGIKVNYEKETRTAVFTNAEK